jgi:hypothetical protein
MSFIGIFQQLQIDFVTCDLELKVYVKYTIYDPITGKSLSEALIFASTNPQHDERLFIEKTIFSANMLNFKGQLI